MDSKSEKRLLRVERVGNIDGGGKDFISSTVLRTKTSVRQQKIH